jgi:hypothetical protein
LHNSQLKLDVLSFIKKIKWHPKLEQNLCFMVTTIGAEYLYIAYWIITVLIAAVKLDKLASGNSVMWTFSLGCAVAGC